MGVKSSWGAPQLDEPGREQADLLGQALKTKGTSEEKKVARTSLRTPVLEGAPVLWGFHITEDSA